MCSCYRTKRKGKGSRSRNCLCWFPVSMFFSLLAVLVVGGLEIHTGGPIPTYDYSNGSRVLFATSVINFCCLIVCILIIVKVVENRIIGLFGLLGLALGICMSLYCLYALVQLPNADDTSTYVKEYYKEHKKPPPTLDMFQVQAMYFSDWACCGGDSFNDYAVTTKHLKTNKNGSYEEFDAPGSCCRKEFYEKDKENCGKNLIFRMHEIEYQIVELIIKKMPNDIKDFDFTNVMNDIIQEFKQKYNMTINDPNTSDAEKKKADILLTEITKYKDERKESVKIQTLGCGQLFELLLKNQIPLPSGTPMGSVDNLNALLYVVLLTAILKLILDSCNVAIYVYYYIKFNFPPSAVEIQDGTTQEDVGSSAVMLASSEVSEGIPNPVIDDPPPSYAVPSTKTSLFPSPHTSPSPETV